jgi:hypothetical protein
MAVENGEQQQSPGMGLEAAIREIIDRRDTGLGTLLLSVFRPDMVWAWPATYTSTTLSSGVSHWAGSMLSAGSGRGHCSTIAARRCRIEISAQGDGAFAVVDIDTLWRNDTTGAEDHLLGRTVPPEGDTLGSSE